MGPIKTIFGILNPWLSSVDSYGSTNNRKWVGQNLNWISFSRTQTWGVLPVQLQLWPICIKNLIQIRAQKIIWKECKQMLKEGRAGGAGRGGVVVGWGWLGLTCKCKCLFPAQCFSCKSGKSWGNFPGKHRFLFLMQRSQQCSCQKYG